jgi:hypothetical protein
MIGKFMLRNNANTGVALQKLDSSEGSYDSSKMASVQQFKSCAHLPCQALVK